MQCPVKISVRIQVVPWFSGTVLDTIVLKFMLLFRIDKIFMQRRIYPLYRLLLRHPRFLPCQFDRFCSTVGNTKSCVLISIQTKHWNDFVTQKSDDNLKQELPSHSTIVQRECLHIPYAILFSRRLDCGCYN